MGDITGKSLWIAIKIWIIAILLNTIIGAFFVANPGDMLLLIFIFGAVYAAMFSFPVVFVFFILLIVLAKLRYSFAKSMMINYATGLICALSCSWIFFQYMRDAEFSFIFFTAGISGILAILTQTKAIRNLVGHENILDELIKPRQNETEPT